MAGLVGFASCRGGGGGEGGGSGGLSNQEASYPKSTALDTTVHH